MDGTLKYALIHQLSFKHGVTQLAPTVKSKFHFAKRVMKFPRLQKLFLHHTQKI